MDRTKREWGTDGQTGELRARRLRPLPDHEAAEVLFLVAEATEVPAALLLADTRCRAEIARARHLAMYLMHVALQRRMEAVAHIFGRHHTTVSYACRAIEDARDDPVFEDMVAGLETALAGSDHQEVRRAAA